jgi:hypothetical protein
LAGVLCDLGVSAAVALTPFASGRTAAAYNPAQQLPLVSAIIGRVSFRVVSWNMHCAGRSSDAWEYLLQLEPDHALLQEVIEIPDGVADRFSVLQLRARWKDGGQQRFSTVVLAAAGPCESHALESKLTWVNEELARFAGNVVSTRIRLGEADLRVVSVHSPAWPIPGERLTDFDTSGVKLTQQKVDIWVADLLSAAIPRRTADEWIIGGDFNLSETLTCPSFGGSLDGEGLRLIAPTIARRTSARSRTTSSSARCTAASPATSRSLSSSWASSSRAAQRSASTSRLISS